MPTTDSTGMVDMRGGRPVRAGTYPFEGGDGVVSGWHSHDLHQLEYAFAGTVEVETRAGHYLLPPQQAVWIPAGLRHETTIRHRVKTVSVFFDPGYFPDPARFPGARHEARILAAAPVLREMILYASRWPIDRDGSDEVADGFFTTLAHLVGELLDRAAPLYLPTSTDPVVSAAMAYTDAHLATATAAVVSRSVGLSERSLRRRFGAVAGLSWRSYLLQSRLLRAMVLLAEPGPTVLDVATAVGFDSVSAFTRTFAHHVGETPTTYRRRAAATP